MISFRLVAKKSLYPLLGLIISETILLYGITPLLTRGLGPEDWGVYNILLSILILPMMFTFAISSEEGSMVRFIAEEQARDGDARKIYSAMMWIWIAASIVG